MDRKTDTKHLVCASHASPEYRLEFDEVTTHPDCTIPEYFTGYYVSLSGFGCSKTYPTPHAAIKGLLQANGCYAIHIEDITP